MPDPRRLAELARELLPDCVSVGAADPRAEGPAEPGGPPRATPARLREFAAGRRAARAAMAAAGMTDIAVPIGADRAPVWPAGVSGSITHSADACLAAVGFAHDINALGLDLEPVGPLTADLRDVICLPEERAWLLTQAATERDGLATLIFCAKEAVYKAQYPMTQQLFGFDVVRIDIRVGTFTATFRSGIGDLAPGDVLCGRWGHAEGHVLTVVADKIPSRLPI